MTGTRVCIFAGGTGGHVFPALAVADRLREDGWAVSWVGTRRGIEARVVPGARLPPPFHLLAPVPGRAPRGGVRGDGGGARAGGRDPAPHPPCPRPRHGRIRPRPRAGSRRGCSAVPCSSTSRTRSRVSRTGCSPALRRGSWRASPTPSRAVGKGGSAPPGTRCGPRSPLFLRRPGAMPIEGRSCGCSSSGEARGRRPSTGPCRRRRLAWSARSRSATRRAKAGRPTPPGSATARRGVEATVTAFVEDVAEAYAWADVAVCRAGASTVAELSATGVGSILVPYPWAADDHQTANARFLERRGAACVVPEEGDLVARLASLIGELAGDRERQLAMAEAAWRSGRRDAAERVAACCREYECPPLFPVPPGEPG